MRLLPLFALSLTIACGDKDPADDDDDPDFEDAIDADGDGFDEDEDCDDADADIHPDADEVCDGVDNNCDGTVDDDALDLQTFFADSDGDGYGDAGAAVQACDQPEDAVEDDSDCDDADGDINPAAAEVCDGVDNNCNGTVDASAEDASVWYADADGDGFGDAGSKKKSCDQPDGYVADDTDCDDEVDWINPDGEQYCTGLDTDCDPATTDSGMVSYVDTESYLYDVTADFEGGTAESPLPITLDADGTWYFCDSTWYVALDIQGDVDLVGLYGAETSVLSGGGKNSIITLETAGADFTMTEMTLQEGFGMAVSSLDELSGGGVACVADVGVVIEASTIVDNEAEAGAGIFASFCDLTIRDSVVGNNTADYGGGIAIYGGLLTVESVTFEGNGAYAGGGVLTDSEDDVVDGIFDDVVFTGNTASFGGGLAALVYTDNYVEVGLVGSTASSAGFFGNSATYGGGAYLEGDPVVTFVDIDFGTGGDANDPVDIYLHGVSESYAELGDDVSLECTETSCE